MRSRRCRSSLGQVGSARGRVRFRFLSGANDCFFNRAALSIAEPLFLVSLAPSGGSRFFPQSAGPLVAAARIGRTERRASLLRALISAADIAASSKPSSTEEMLYERFLTIDFITPSAGLTSEIRRRRSHIRCKMTASFRATAITARRWPRVSRCSAAGVCGMRVKPLSVARRAAVTTGCTQRSAWR